MSMIWSSRREPKGRARLLAVSPRSGEQRRSQGWRQYLPMAVPLLILLLVGAGWAAVLVINDALFESNPVYTLRHFDIKTDSASITPELVREYLGLAEGTNIFTIDIGALREKFMQKSPSVKTMVIARRLPDTLTIEITERNAVARVGRGKPLAIDSSGYVYNLRSGARSLPVISGLNERYLRPGTQISGLTMNAIEAIEVSSAMQWPYPVRIESIDVGNGEHLNLRLLDGEQVRFSWSNMGAGTPDSRAALVVKLRQLAEALQTAATRNQRLMKIDMTFNANYVPVTEF